MIFWSYARTATTKIKRKSLFLTGEEYGFCLEDRLQRGKVDNTELAQEGEAHSDNKDTVGEEANLKYRFFLQQKVKVG